MNSPFNEAKYKALLEGLEVSEVFISQLEYSNRIDAEYYRPKFIEYENLISSKNGIKLKELSDFLIGPFGSAFTVDNYTDDSMYRYIRGKDVKQMILMDNDNVFLPKKDYERLIKYSLKENDILVSVVGTLGNAAIVTKKDLPAIFSCKSTVLRPRKVNASYLIVYINSKYGNNLLLRKERGAIQKGLNLDDLKDFLVFLPSNSFQNTIQGLFKKSLSQIELAKNKYTQAEEILLEELGLKDFEPSNEPVNIKSFKDSFLATGRLDAEYYQKKYEDFIRLIKSYKNGFESFLSACNLKDKNFTPDEKKQYKYIELANIGKTGDITGCTVSLGKDLPTRARRIVHENDVIISSIEGSLDSCALITKEYDNALCSTGFYVVNSDKINSETLLILFKLEPMQNILKKGCSGTILTAINKTELEQIPIPLVDYTKQQQIAELIEESFALKKQSEKLLETAKRAVEIAIEESEEKAIEYLENNVNLL